MPATVPFYDVLGLDCLIWAIWSVAVGWWASRWPHRSVENDGWLTRLRPWERDGRLYARVGIRRWKPWLPDFGAAFGGRPKRLGARRDPADWLALAGETRRAERVHWLMLAALLPEAWLRGGVIMVPMIAYAAVSNLPCIVVQRYNRGRLVSLWSRRTSRVDRTAAPAGSDRSR